MEASAKPVAKILHSSDQFLVPFFQRAYKWGPKNWNQLQGDLWGLMEDGRHGKHFLGPLVCTADGGMPGEISAYQLIDGQQRLTTLALLLAGLRDVAQEHEFATLAEKINENYLIHKHERGLQRYKLVPRTGDREVFVAIVDQKPFDRQSSLQIVKAYEFFGKHIRRLAQAEGEKGLARLFESVTSGLYLVVIVINEENPYEIFESLNSTGLPLAESDLIRNYLFMHVAQDDQQEFHDEHWDPFEKMFDAADGFPAVDATSFYRNFLMRRGAYSKPKATFVDFKAYCEETALTPPQQVGELKRFAALELLLHRPTTCRNKQLTNRLTQLAAMDVATCHPLLLNLLDRQGRGDLGEEALIGCLDDLASFVLRRSICGENTRGYSKWFPEAIRAIQDDPREDLRGYWFRRGWPDDRTFVDSLVAFPVYRREPKKCRLVLGVLESNHGHKEKVDPSTLSIEHVLPQTLSGRGAAEWKKALGADWESLHSQWLNTLGNLTLTGYNSDLSNKPFAVKREAYLESNVSLNKYFKNCQQWGADEIEQRGMKMAAIVVELWPRPEGGPEFAPSDGRKALKQGKEQRAAYWGQLIERLRANPAWDRLPETTGESRLEMPTATKAATMLAWFKVGQQQLTAELTLRKSRGRDIYGELEAERDAIEAELGFKPEWNDHGRRGLSVTLEEVSIRDPLDWPGQLDWLATKLTALHQVVLPRVQQIDARLDEQPEDSESTRSSWEEKIGAQVLGLCDQVLMLVNEQSEEDYQLKYLKHYMSIASENEFKNVVSFWPRRGFVWMVARPKNRDRWAKRFGAAGLETEAHENRQLLVRIEAGTVGEHRAILAEYLKSVVENRKKGSKRPEELVAFWRQFAERLKSRQGVLTPQTPRPQAWMDLSTGRGGVWLVASVNSIKQRASVGLVLGGEASDRRFAALQAEATQIEAEVGEPVQWVGGPDRKQLRVYVRLPDVDVRDPATHPMVQDWMIDKLELFRGVFLPRVAGLD
ncbi:hypothetical protein Pla175_13160 [Pirellulimonas nuda]|uniref:DUF4268 domain-containing protein n=1 Tax=Pirellulimonas nuda TaxID=2528009 RepID=A0A518D8Z4_9BACT|nr:DUF4268 domain-containing protein [Pirellulimonas nuda]QDU87949.1 hypothetical protein Pla175_13160 [Pirellulimonas nuda]